MAQIRPKTSSKPSQAHVHYPCGKRRWGAKGLLTSSTSEAQQRKGGRQRKMGNMGTREGKSPIKFHKFPDVVSCKILEIQRNRVSCQYWKVSRWESSTYSSKSDFLSSCPHNGTNLPAITKNTKNTISLKNGNIRNTTNHFGLQNGMIWQWVWRRFHDFWVSNNKRQGRNCRKCLSRKPAAKSGGLKFCSKTWLFRMATFHCATTIVIHRPCHETFAARLCLWKFMGILDSG